MAPGQGARSDRAGGAGAGGEGPTPWEELRGPGRKLPHPPLRKAVLPAGVTLTFFPPLFLDQPLHVNSRS